MNMAWALAGAVEEAGAEYTLAVMPTRHEKRATELTAVLDAGLERADVLIGLTAASGAPTYSRKVAALLGQKRLRALSVVMRSMDNWTRGAALADCEELDRRGHRLADVLIGLTAASGAPTYSRKVAELLGQKRLRALSMVMRSMDNWTRGAALADYEELDRLGHRLADVWAAGSQVTITSAAGTHFTAGVTKEPVMGHPVIVECGIAREPGREAAFSDGEISQRPLAGTAEGTLVVDGPVAKIGAGDDPIRIEVRAGKVVSVEGGQRA